MTTIYRVEILPQALRDVEEAYRWIESNIDSTTAASWYYELLSCVQSLETMPKRCAIAPEGKEFQMEIRQLLVGKKRAYRVLFTVDETTVYILHVRHSKRAPLEVETEPDG